MVFGQGGKKETIHVCAWNARFLSSQVSFPASARISGLTQDRYGLAGYGAFPNIEQVWKPMVSRERRCTAGRLPCGGLSRVGWMVIIQRLEPVIGK
jgi:hypothetical protein